MQVRIELLHGPDNTQLFHSAAERVRVEVKHPCCTTWAFDYTLSILEDLQNMSALDTF